MVMVPCPDGKVRNRRMHVKKGGSMNIEASAADMRSYSGSSRCEEGEV